MRAAILVRLLDRPQTGYELMQAHLTPEGMAAPLSAGSVYPTLDRLIAEGLVTVTVEPRRRLYTLTERGRRLARRQEMEDVAPAGSHRGLRADVEALVDAIEHIVAVGTPSQRRRAVQHLTAALDALERIARGPE